MSGLFNVFFDGRNWVGVVIEDNGDSVKAGKYIFGAEPTPLEIFAWAKEGCPGLVLVDTQRSLNDFEKVETKQNPKRMQKETRRALENKPMGSYAQAKLQEALAERKKGAAISYKQRRAQEQDERFRKRVEKKKKQRRGH